MRIPRIGFFAVLFGFALCIASVFARPAFAVEPIVGTWKLVSWVFEDVESHEQKQPFGQHPKGQLIFTPENRTMALITAMERRGGDSDADRAKSFMTMFAVAGKYRVDGSKYVLTVEIASSPALVGAVQSREFKIEGNRLTIVAAPMAVALMNDHMTRITAVYERVTQ